MKISETVIRKVAESGITGDVLQITNLSYQKELPVFDHSKLTIITRDDGIFFADVLISKRIILAYAQSLLQKKNIPLLPDFIETSSTLLIADILNIIDRKYNYGLEISSSDNIRRGCTTAFLANIRFHNINAPIIIKVNTEMLWKLITKYGFNPDELSESEVFLRGEKYIPLYVIGNLSVSDILKMPSVFDVIISQTIIAGRKKLFDEEEDMNDCIKEILNSDELYLPVQFIIELGNLSLTQTREILSQSRVSEIISGRECKIILGKTVIARGDISENNIRISKIFI
ncbi:MAG: hypothetical protein N3B13_03635 [Deltaproteobacteria bacterium]|nr:hypothetical protein [Deltaproteobacteria bacterium]